MRMIVSSIVVILIVAGTLFYPIEMKAQRVGIKTNALYWAGMTPNLGLEVRLSRFYTLNMEGHVCVFDVSGYKLDHANFMPEVRYWFSGRPQTRHFVGVMGIASAYNMQLKQTVRKGEGVGVGLTYGYAFVLGRRWSLETTIGVGTIYHIEKKYEVSQPLSHDFVNHRGFAVSPLKLGVSFTYLLK